MMVRLTDLVDEYILECEQDSKHRFSYFLALAKTGLNIIHREATGTVKQLHLPVETTGAVLLPKDCVKIASVFILDRNNCVVALSQSDSLISLNNNCGDIYQACNCYPYAWGFPNNAQHTRNGYNVGAYYGIGGDSPFGTYQYNQEFGRLDLSSNVCAHSVIIHYIGLPESFDGDYMVHPYLTEALKDFIDFKSVVRKRGVSMAERSEKENRWISSLIQAKMNLWGLSESQIIDAARHNFTPTPKT